MRFDVINLGKIEKYWMLRNLPLVSLSMSDIFGIDTATIISLIFDINFAKIHLNSEVFSSITLLFSKMLSLANRFH